MTTFNESRSKRTPKKTFKLKKSDVMKFFERLNSYPAKTQSKEKYDENAKKFSNG